MPCILRAPTAADFPQIDSLGRWFQENSLYEDCGWSSAKAFHWVREGEKSDSSTFMVVAEEDGIIVGFFLGNIVEYFFSEKILAQDLVLVFKPSYRDGIGDHIRTMIGNFCNWAEQKNAHEVCIGITSGIAGSGYGKLIKRLGFSEVGTIMKREV
mgnify:CR=1 FL=1|jgi:hypothetical protein